MFWGFRKKKDNPRPANAQAYRAFTEEFDEEADAADLVASLRERRPPGYMRELQDALEVPTSARLKAVQRSIDFQARLKAGHDLGERPCFTLLIDHSGSMKGPKAMAAAVAADVASGIFDHERRPLDILGFTTSSWKGGHSRQAWRVAGCPDDPGRLCDLLHIVYRDAAHPRRDVSRNLAMMMAPDFLKENIDGEALLWARRRIEALEPTAWVCVLISDGVPMDDSTVEANSGPANGWYLEAHLKKVVEEFNAETHIRLGCLALDHNPRAPFRNIEHVNALGEAATQLFDLMEALIWPELRAEA